MKSLLVFVPVFGAILVVSARHGNLTSDPQEEWCTWTTYCNDGYHCCSDNLHCCPYGYTCDLFHLKCIASGKNENDQPTDMKLTESTKKNTTKDWCTSTTYCNDGYHCCSDNLHCCPNGYICDLVHLKCIASGINDIEKSINMKLTESAEKNITKDWCTSTTYCNDGYHCCSDNLHCCPNGYICDLVNLQCIASGKNDIEKSINMKLTESAEKNITKDWCTSTTYCNDGYHCCSDNLHCCPYGYICDLVHLKCVHSGKNENDQPTDMKLTESAEQNTTMDWCTSTLFCPDGTHCCSDNIHCCPNGYACDLVHLKCIASGKTESDQPTDMKLTESAGKNTTKDWCTSTLFCNDGYHCCSDNVHCCPNGYSCDLVHQKCIASGKNSAGNSEQITREKTDNQSVTIDWCTLTTYCNDGYHCCSDNLHCCPNGYTCDLVNLQCIPGSNGKGVVRLSLTKIGKKNVKTGWCTPDAHCPEDFLCCPDNQHCCPTSAFCRGSLCFHSENLHSYPANKTIQMQEDSFSVLLANDLN